MPSLTQPLYAVEDKTTRAIPFFNVLWAEVTDLEVTIRYAHAVSSRIVRPALISYPLDKTNRTHASAWVAHLLDRAYGASQRRKRIKILVNPFGGKGKAAKYYASDIEPILAAAGCALEVERTQYSGHAADIAENLDPDAHDVVACCSGDGVPHEVFTGLGRRADAARALALLAVVQLPCGSGNALSINLSGTDSPSLAALTVVKGVRMRMDLASVTQAGRPRTLSFLSQSLGIVAESDLGTDNLRWLGAARFTVGYLIRLVGKTVYPADIAVAPLMNDKPAIRAAYAREHALPSPAPPPPAPPPGPSPLPPLRFGTVDDPLPADWSLIPHNTLGTFYAGNMTYMAADTPFFSAALPCDGAIDLVTIDGDIPRHAALALMLAVAKDTFFDRAEVQYQKVTGFRVVPRGRGDGCISIDGERVPFRPFQVEVHHGLGTVLSRSGHVYEREAR